jgi:hypothetical protein
MLQPAVRIERRRCTPKTFPCPHCGRPGRRKGRRTFTRTVRGLAYHAIHLIELTTAEYRAACACCTSFRSQVADILPRADYTNGVREAVLDRLLGDHLNVEQLRRSLKRDFHLDLSDGFIYDCLDWKVRQVDGAAYRHWALAHFSGTLCVDEIHLGKKTLLLATDPLADVAVAFALVSANDQEHMRRFLQNLQAWGFCPQVVVTDGSNLYPALLADLWPHARHQLCVFHVLQDLNGYVLDAVKRLRRQLARRGRGGRRRRRGRPRKGCTRRRGPTLKEQAHFVFKKRYLLVRRRADLRSLERRDLQTVLAYLPELRVLRQFVDRLHQVLSAEQSVHQAWCRRAALLRTPAFQAVPELVRALDLLRPEAFAKLVAFLQSPAYRRVRTNNHVERMNRRLRYLEKVRYKWRRRRTLVRFVLLMLDRWRRERPPRAVPTESEATEPEAQHRSRPRARPRPAA